MSQRAKRVSSYMKQEKRVAFWGKVRFTLGLVRPVDNERSKAAEAGVDFL